MAVALASMPAMCGAQPTRYRVSAPSPQPTSRIDRHGLNAATASTMVKYRC